MRKTTLRKILSKSGEINQAMQVTIDLDDPKYLEQKAIELVVTAQRLGQTEQRKDYIQQAITCLAVSAAMREDGPAQKTNKKRKADPKGNNEPPKN